MRGPGAGQCRDVVAYELSWRQPRSRTEVPLRVAGQGPHPLSPQKRRGGPDPGCHRVRASSTRELHEGIEMIRVLLVDDQSMVRTGFRTILESEDGITVVGEAENGQIAIDRALELSPDEIGRAHV